MPRFIRLPPEKRGPAVANPHTVSVDCKPHAGRMAMTAEYSASTMSEPTAAAPLPPPHNGDESAYAARIPAMAMKANEANSAQLNVENATVSTLRR